MVSALRSLAWLLLIIAAILTVIGGLSFLIDIPGMWLNDEPVQTNEQRTLFVGYSLGIALLSSAFLWLTRASFIRRYARMLSAARWLEELPTENRTGRRTIFSITFLISIAAIFVFPGIGNFGDRMFLIIALPVIFCSGFLLTFIVVGFQVINPFCPRPVLRFFSLITIAFFSLGSILCIPEMFIARTEDPAVLWAPMISLGAAAGSIIILKKWTDFHPSFGENNEVEET